MRDFLLLLCLLPIFLISCTTHTAYKPANIGGLNEFELLGITKQNGYLYSYSSLSGDITSKLDEYELIDEQKNITIYGLESYQQDTRNFLKFESETGIVASDISSALDWLANSFGDMPPLKLEIVLVPPNVSYSYVTRYKFTQDEPRARFAFRFNSDAAQASRENLIETLIHEASHIYFNLAGARPPNKETNEAISFLIGICAIIDLDGNKPEKLSGVLPDEDTMTLIRQDEYAVAISKLRENPPVITGRIIAELTLETLRHQHGPTGADVNSATLRHCQMLVSKAPDLTQSLHIGF